MLNGLCLFVILAHEISCERKKCKKIEVSFEMLSYCLLTKISLHRCCGLARSCSVKSSECCDAFDQHFAISSVSGAQLSLVQSQREGIWRLLPSSVLTEAAPVPHVRGVFDNKTSTGLLCHLLMLFQSQSKCHQPFVTGSASELSSNPGLHQNVATVLAICL